MPVPACILVRHAHADWPGYRGRDFDRPLTQRGLEQAHATGRAIRETGIAIAGILASSACRTEQTARILLEHLQLPDAALQLRDSLYNAGVMALQDALQGATARDASVVLVAHNPSISELARLLSGKQSLAPFRPGDWQAFPGS